MMSHELRTPLNAVVGYAELLAEEGVDDPDQAAADLGRISGSARALLATIDDLLELSRIESTQGEAVLHDVAVHEVARDAAAAVRARVPIYLPDASPRVRADPVALRRVLVNLLGNAATFTDAGEIRVEVAATPDGARLTVRDTGPGFDPALAERIFEPFVMANDSSTRTHGGTGLGLALCRRLVQRMRGRIWAETSATGAAFHVELPRTVDPR